VSEDTFCSQAELVSLGIEESLGRINSETVALYNCICVNHQPSCKYDL
tara:strand:- start:579 stop:722 length:144 start_codon:yes stop_codon:yes gene_type:complete